MPKEHLSVMISSTILDLPEHRPEIRDACLQQDMQPIMMENLPASDAEAISVSLKLVDDADVYIGIFAHRYGYVPKRKNPKRISITEMEYNRAVKRKIPRLIFVMDKAHQITIDNVEIGVAAVKLAKLKKRLLTNNISKSFKSPEDLRAHAINSLSEIRKRYLLATRSTSDTNILLAHSKYDWNVFVGPLVDRIRGAGLAVWIDLHQPNPDQLVQVLKMCGCMVLCVSPSALRSKHVKTELDYFLEREKTVIPFICRKANLPGKLHKIPSFKYSQMDSLIEHIKSLRLQSPFAKYEP